MGIAGRIKAIVEKYGGDIVEDYRRGYDIPKGATLSQRDIEAIETIGKRTERERIRRIGGGVSARAITQQQQVEAQRKTAEEVRKKEDTKKIESERQRLIYEARQQYQNVIRDIKNIQQRKDRLSQLHSEIAEANVLAKIQRVEKGIVTGATVYGTRITAQTVAEFKEQITGAEYKAKVAEAIRAGKKVEFVPEGVRITERITPITPKEAKEISFLRGLLPAGFEEKYVYPLAMKTKYKGMDLTYEEWKAREKELEKAYREKLPYVSVFKEPAKVTITAAEIIMGKKLPEPEREEAIEFIGDLYTMGFFGRFLTTMVAKKGKKQAVELVSTKEADKKKVERIAKALQDAIDKGRTPIESEQNLMKIMKYYKDVSVEAGVDKKIIIDNLKGMLRFARNQGYLYVKPEEPAVFLAKAPPVKPPIVKPPMKAEKAISFLGAPPVEVKEVPVILAAAYTGMGLYERTWTPEEQFLKATSDILEITPVEKAGVTAFETLKPTENILGWTAPEVTPKLDIGVSPRVPSKLDVGVSPRLPQRIREQLAESPLSKLSIRQQALLKTRIQTRLKEKVLPRERTALREQLSVLSALSLQQRYRQLQKQRLKLRQVTKPRVTYPYPRLKPKPKLKVPPPVPLFKFVGVKEEEPLERGGDYYPQLTQLYMLNSKGYPKQAGCKGVTLLPNTPPKFQ